jgi:hypothetical protein
VCAALLPDGRVVTSGGRHLESDGTSVSEAAMELLSPSPSGLPTSLGLDPLPLARHLHTCTVLHDGSVLLAGGLTEVDGQPQALSEALLYMPLPRD